jgi:HlyD family type I secretion membrane fusion protein
MRPDIDPKRFKRLPLDMAEFYQKTVRAGGPDGALDDARGPVRFGLIALGLFFGVFLLWAAFAPLSGAAVAPGVVTVAGDRQKIQSATGGVVTEVMAREGQTVRPGQLLVRLNGVASGARLDQTDARRVALLAAQARLIAERDNLQTIGFPDDLVFRQNQPVVAQAIRNQEALFQRRKAVIDAERRIAAGRVTSGAAQASAARAQLTLIRRELADIESLYRRGYAPISRVRALQRAAVDLEAEVATTGSGAAEAELTGLRQEAERAGQTVEQLRTVQDALAQVEPEMRITRQGAERDLLRAPFGGKVVGLTALGPGSVLSPGQTLMEILPAGRVLLIEAKVRPEDVDDVRINSTATVRLPSVNPRGRSSFDGVVTTLSADRLTDPATGKGYYLALIAVDPEQLASANVELRPGLPATVNITTQRRTFFDYLFSPLGDAMSGAMREE